MARILIVEDELPMRTALQDCLEAEGYRVILALDGESGLERGLEEKPDLVLLDVMMPKIDGFQLCHELRRLGRNMPILMLTAKGMVRDKVAGFEAGADDYLVKPFSTEELMARIRALLRRTERNEKALGELEIGRLKVDFKKQEAWQGRKSVRLTRKEFGMLKLLVEHQGEVVTREQFLDLVWGYGSFPTTRTVDNHIASLRSKIEKNPESPRHIVTVHGTGYCLNLSPKITKS